MKRLVVHIGAEQAGATAVQRGLFQNADLLAQRGVYLPRTGRLELAPLSVCHHPLAWSVDPNTPFPSDPRLWDDLADELDAVNADTVVLSSEIMARMLTHPVSATRLQRRLSGLCSDVTLVLVVRDQLSLLNSLYNQRVKMFEVVGGFEDYLRRTDDSRVYDYGVSLERWYRSDVVRFVAVPFASRDALAPSLAERAVDPHGGPDPVSVLLGAAGIDVPHESLVATDQEVDRSLGPIGVEAARLLGTYLRGTYPDFSFAELAARKLHRAAAARARRAGWCDERYWGWRPETAARIASSFADSNQQFARAVWGTDWPIPMPVDVPTATARLLDLGPKTAEHVQRHVLEFGQRFGTLRKSAAA